MNVKTYSYPKSSFLSIGKDMEIITSKMIENDNLKKLLFYTTEDCLEQPKLDEKQTIELFGTNIRMVPKLYIDRAILNYVVISFDNFQKNMRNPEFRNNIIGFNIICHYNQWELKGDFQLRPYRIAAEIDSMFNNTHLSGIGKLEFINANQISLNDEFAGLSLNYLAIHGEEDKKDGKNLFQEGNFDIDFI